MIGIYKITSPSNRVYIGQSVDIERRFRCYHHNKNNRMKEQTALYNSFSKHGIENHIFEVIEECTVEKLNERERHWQEFYEVIKNGLNCRLQGCDGKSGYLSKETRERMSKSMKGRPNKNKGLKRSEEIKAKIAAIMKSRLPINTKKVINIDTGEIFNSIGEAAIANNIKRTTLNARLSGQSINLSNLRYYDNN